jgi:hypothetical protein
MIDQLDERQWLARKCRGENIKTNATAATICFLMFMTPSFSRAHV